MGLFSDPAAEWTQAAYGLGAPLCPIVKPFNPRDESVHAIQRRLGPPGQGGHPDTHWISGERRGVCFVAGGRTVVTRSDEGTETTHYTHWIAEIDPPLWMGLHGKLKKGNALTRVFQSDAPQWKAWDAARLSALFAVRMNDGFDPHDLLMAAYEAGLEIEVDDHAVRIVRESYALHANTVGPPIDSVVTIAERLQAARLRLGPARWELDAAAVWGAFSARCSLAFDRDRLRLHGTLEGCRVDVRLIGEPVPKTLLKVRYPKPLGIGLFIGPGHVLGLFKLFGVQDIELGDPVFDEAFIVKGNPEAVVKQVVHAEMRRELMGLAARRLAVTVFDDHLEVSAFGMVMDGPALDELLLRGMAVVRGFWRRG